MTITDDIKKQILEEIKRSPGKFTNCSEADIDKLNQNTVTRNLCIDVLELLIYDCAKNRDVVRKHTIYDKALFELAENAYTLMPQNPEYVDGCGIYVAAIPNFNSISDNDLASYLPNIFKTKELYREILKQQSFTSRAERILKSIESIEGQPIQLSETENNVLQQIYLNIKKELSNNQQLDLHTLDSLIKSFSAIAVDIWNKYLDTGRCMLVHNYSRGYIKDFVPSKYLSASLVSDRYMALFQENYGNNYGLIIRPKKIVSADSHDVFVHNRVENIDIDAFLSGEVPPLLFPWEIEQEAVEKTLRINGELLNYDNGYELPEIVLEDYSVIGTYYRTNGEGELSPNYEAAFELAKKYNVELRELDMNKAREKLGLEARQPKSK